MVRQGTHLTSLNIGRERIGTLAFEQEYQANPLDDSLRAFKHERVRFS